MWKANGTCGVELEALERQIAWSVSQDWQRALNLRKIRDEALYRDAGFRTWAAYLRERLDLTECQVNREIGQAARHALVCAVEFPVPADLNGQSGNTH